MNIKSYLCKILFFVFILVVIPGVSAGSYSSYSTTKLKQMEADARKQLSKYQTLADKEYKKWQDLVEYYKDKPANKRPKSIDTRKTTYLNYLKKVNTYSNKIKSILQELNSRKNGQTSSSKQAKLQSLSLSGPSSIASNGKATYTCTAKYSDGKNKTVTPTWKVSNTKYASISSGKLTAKSAGVGKTVTVTASYGGKKVSKSITIAQSLTLTTLSISSSTTQLKVNSAITLTCKAKYSDGTTKTVTPTWSVSNTKYASINSGKITAKSAGAGKTVTVTASYGGKKVTKQFTIAQSVALKTLSISSSTTQLKSNLSIALTCKANYCNGVTKSVKPTWSVSNSQYATISSNGILTAKSAGAGKTVTVTASYAGKKVSKKFTIAQPAALQSISISLSNTRIRPGGGTYVTCTARYSDGSTKTVTPTLSVSNSKYIYVYDNSILVAKSAGKGKNVTVTAFYGGKKTSKKISIAKK